MTWVAGDGLERVRSYVDRGEHLVVGLMTGTSVDAVDAALVRFRGLGLESTHELLAYRETPIEPSLRREVLDVAAASSLPPERLMRLDAALGKWYAAAVLELLAGVKLGPPSVDAVGLHGQTVRHVSRKEGGGQALTLQLGSAAIVAERTGIAVVSDFRSRDTAAGGEGAPLVPLVDWWLFRSPAESRVLLNLGGMANLTYLPAGGGLDDVLAFDTGPGNAVLDELVAMHSGNTRRVDHEGADAARGRASAPLLDELMADPFFSLRPPRSTGRERFGRSFAEGMQARARVLGLGEHDVLATAVELTAASVTEAIRRFVVPRAGVDVVFASGGGCSNPTLLGALARRLKPIRFERVEALGTPSGGKEALAFAFLAHQTLCGRPGNVTGATGATHPVVLGHITPGAPS